MVVVRTLHLEAKAKAISLSLSPGETEEECFPNPGYSCELIKTKDGGMELAFWGNMPFSITLR